MNKLLRLLPIVFIVSCNPTWIEESELQSSYAIVEFVEHKPATDTYEYNPWHDENSPRMHWVHHDQEFKTSLYWTFSKTSSYHKDQATYDIVRGFQGQRVNLLWTQQYSITTKDNKQVREYLGFRVVGISADHPEDKKP